MDMKNYLRTQITLYEEDKNYPIWRRQERRSKYAVQLASWQLRSNSPKTSVRPAKTSPEPHRRIADPHRRITINILEILELPIFAYHTCYTSKHMYNWMKWLRLLGGWHFIAATAIKPPKAACQFAADDILLYKFAIISNGFTSPFGKKEKKNCHLYNTILSLYISYQDITRRVC